VFLYNRREPSGAFAVDLGQFIVEIMEPFEYVDSITAKVAGICGSVSVYVSWEYDCELCPED